MRLEIQDAPVAAGRGYMPKGARQDHCTPLDVLKLVRDVFGKGIDLDPCSNPQSITAARREVWFQYNDAPEPAGRIIVRGSGLVIPWEGDVFCNPPFDHVGRWVAKCRGEYEMGRARQVLLLAPASVSTKWFHAHIPSTSGWQLWKGRIKFIGSDNGCPFNPLFAYWGPNADRFEQAFGAKGMVFRP